MTYLEPIAKVCEEQENMSASAGKYTLYRRLRVITIRYGGTHNPYTYMDAVQYPSMDSLMYGWRNAVQAAAH